MNILDQGLGLVPSGSYYTVSGFLLHTPEPCLSLLLEAGTHNTDSVKPLAIKSWRKSVPDIDPIC